MNEEQKQQAQGLTSKDMRGGGSSHANRSPDLNAIPEPEAQEKTGEDLGSAHATDMIDPQEMKEALENPLNEGIAHPHYVAPMVLTVGEFDEPTDDKPFFLNISVPNGELNPELAKRIANSFYACRAYDPNKLPLVINALREVLEKNDSATPWNEIQEICKVAWDAFVGVEEEAKPVDPDEA